MCNYDVLVRLDLCELILPLTVASFWGKDVSLPTFIAFEVAQW